MLKWQQKRQIKTKQKKVSRVSKFVYFVFVSIVEDSPKWLADQTAALFKSLIPGVFAFKPWKQTFSSTEFLSAGVLLLPDLQRKIHLVPNFKVIFQYFQRFSRAPKSNTMILSKKLTFHYTLPDFGSVFEIWFWEIITLVRFFSFKFHSNLYFNDLDSKRFSFLTDIFKKSFKLFTFWNIKLKYFRRGFSRNWSWVSKNRAINIIYETYTVHWYCDLMHFFNV